MSTLSLAAVLADSARRFPGKVALVEGAQRRTYAEVWRSALEFAGYLREGGMETGDTVALLCPNVVEFVHAYYAILAAGGVVVPVPTLLNADEIAYLVADSGATRMICHPTLAGLGAKVAASTGVEVIDPADFAARPLRNYVSRSPEDTAVVFYTSGTTGKPKGALLTHLNLVMCATVNAFDTNQFGRDEVVLGCLPLFHTFGQTIALNSTFRIGATLVLQPRFDPAAAIALMRAERVTSFLGVPSMFIRLAEAGRSVDGDLPRLRTCISGGASLPVAVLEDFEQLFGTTVYEGYGLSETSPTAAVNQDHYGTRPGTVGHAVWGVEVEIADAAVEERIDLLPNGTLGEIVVRGHNVFSGYHNNPDATRAAVIDGWFRSGDIGVKDQHGYITIVDRKKDLIIRNGFNVYPREIEEVLIRHPSIAQVAVIGIPRVDVGEEICAVVVPVADQSIDGEAVIEWAKSHLGRHKYPRLVEITDQLPMGPTHKVLKRELRRQFTSALA